MVYCNFKKSFRRKEEFRKNPHGQIPPESPYRISQSLAKIRIQLNFKISFPFEISLESDPTRFALTHYASQATAVVSLNPPTGVDRQHKSREARSLYLSALQLARTLRLEFVGHAT
jgi:hypothetical protein